MTNVVTQSKQDHLQTIVNEIFHNVASVHNVETVLDYVLYDSMYDPELISQFKYNPEKYYDQQDNWIIFLFLSQLSEDDYENVPNIEFISCQSSLDKWMDSITVILKFKECFYSFEYLWSSSSGYIFTTDNNRLVERVPVERIVVDYVVKED